MEEILDLGQSEGVLQRRDSWSSNDSFHSCLSINDSSNLESLCSTITQNLEEEAFLTPSLSSTASPRPDGSSATSMEPAGTAQTKRKNPTGFKFNAALAVSAAVFNSLEASSTNLSYPYPFFLCLVCHSPIFEYICNMVV